MSDFKTRLIEERNQLYQRTKKLKNFITSDRYDKLLEIDRKDLKEQLKHMKRYGRVLGRRVDRMKEAEK